MTDSERPARPPPVDLERLAAGLRALRGLGDLRVEELTLLPEGGRLHRHVRIGTRGWIARLPRGSPFRLSPPDHLRYEAAAFLRLAASGRTPRIDASMPPSANIPTGALLVAEIDGRPCALPGDLPAIAESLAIIHRLPPAPEAQRQPVPLDGEPIAGRLAIVRRQLAELAHAPLAPAVRTALAEEVDWAAGLAADPPALTVPRLTIVDSHPGNFLIDRAGRAICVDLDNVVYGQRSIDVAGASLSSSLLWNLPGAPVLGAAAVLAFERAWLAALPADEAAQERAVMRPLRRIVWLRQIVWYARGWAFGEHAAVGPDAIAARDRARALLAPESIDRMRQEWCGPGALPPP